MRNAGVALLFVWAVVATILAIRAGDPPSPSPPPARSGDLGEVESLRREVLELRRRIEIGEEGGPGPVAPAVPAPGPEAPKTYGEAADRLLAEYRRLRDAGRDEEGRFELLERVATLAERDRSLLLVWPVLLREAGDEDEAENVAFAADSATHPDPGGPIDVQCRAALRAILSGDPKSFRRVAAAEVLMWLVEPQAEDFRAALAAARREENEDARDSILHLMGGISDRSVLAAEDVDEYRGMLRREVRARETSLVTRLAEWSSERADFDYVLAEVKKYPSSRLLWSLRGRRALTEGREAECRAALTAVVEDRGASRAARTTAISVLDTLRPWESATVEAVRRLGDEGR